MANTNRYPLLSYESLYSVTRTLVTTYPRL